MLPLRNTSFDYLGIDSCRGNPSGTERKRVNNCKRYFDNHQSLETGNIALDDRVNHVWGEVAGISWHFCLLVARLILPF